VLTAQLSRLVGRVWVLSVVAVEVCLRLEWVRLTHFSPFFIFPIFPIFHLSQLPFLNEAVSRRRHSLFGHVRRMYQAAPVTKPCISVMTRQGSGQFGTWRRQPGRPRKCWMEQVTTSTGLSLLMLGILRRIGQHGGRCTIRRRSRVESKRGGGSSPFPSFELTNKHTDRQTDRRTYEQNYYVRCYPKFVCPSVAYVGASKLQQLIVYMSSVERERERERENLFLTDRFWQKQREPETEEKIFKFKTLTKKPLP